MEATMENILEQITGLVGGYIPNIAGALAILIIGWLVALLISKILKKVLRKTTLDEKLASIITRKDKSEVVNAGDWIAKGVFYFIMLFVLVAFFQALQLTLITEPINNLLTQIFKFAPQILGAGILILIAWIVATLLKSIITKVLVSAKLDERISGESASEEKSKVSISNSLAEIVYWLVFLLFLPAILSTLALEGILEPIQGMIDKILTFLPNILTAGIIVLVGWFVAKIVQKIVTGLLAAVGVDRLSERIGLSSSLGEQTLSGILGFVLFVFILIPVSISALNALALESITQPASNMLNIILLSIPSIFSAMLIIAFAYVIGRIVSSLISNLLKGLGFDAMLVKMELIKQESKYSPSEGAGTLALVAIMFFGVTEAFVNLGFSTLSDLLAQFTVFGGKMLFGLVIFAIGFYFANIVAKTIRKSDTANANLFATIARVAILFFAGAMALQQMGIANEIINLAFGLLLGAVAISTAISFGIGGRDFAARKLEEWNDSASSKS
jgi:hypothetical protein